MGYSIGRKPVWVTLLLLAVAAGCGGGDGSSSPRPVSSGGTSGWSAASRIGDQRDIANFEFYSPTVAQNAAGDAMAVWLEEHSGVLSVRAARYHNGAWSAAEAVNDTALDTASDPRVAIDADGTAVVVWSGLAGGVTAVKSARFNGTTWGSEVQVAASASLPDVALLSSGKFIAVWQAGSGGAPSVASIWSAQYDGSWSAPVRRSDGTHACNEPRIAGTGAGGAIAVWRRDNAAAADIYAQRYNNGSWESAATLVSDTHIGTNFAERPRIAINASGRAIVAWQDTVSGETSVQAGMYDPTTAVSPWSAPEPLESSTEAASFSEVTVDPAGNAFVVWRQRTTSFVDGQMARYVAGTGWVKGMDFESQGVDINHVHVGVDGNGNAMVAWDQSSPYDLRARRRLAATGWQAETNIAAAGTSALSVNGGGQAILIYRQVAANGATIAMYARVFKP